MANPYKSPTDSRLDERTPPTTVSEANVLLALYGFGFLAWVAFIWALNLTFKDMFGGPAPSHTIYVFMISVALSIAVEIAGLKYFSRRHIYTASIGSLVFAGIWMAIVGLPLLMISQGLLYEMANQ